MLKTQAGGHDLTKGRIHGSCDQGSMRIQECYHYETAINTFVFMTSSQVFFLTRHVPQQAFYLFGLDVLMC